MKRCITIRKVTFKKFDERKNISIYSKFKEDQF